MGNLGILCDAEDTIIDITSHVNRVAKLVFREMGLGHLDVTTLPSIHHAFRENNINELKFWDIWQKYDDRVDALKRGEIRLFPDTLKFLDEAGDVYLVTDTPSRKLRPLMQGLGIYDKVKGITCYYPGVPTKPSLSYSVELLRRLIYSGCDSFVMVGDSAVDVEFGKNVEKFFNVPVRTVQVVRRNMYDKADHIVFSLERALDVINGLKYGSQESS